MLRSLSEYRWRIAKYLLATILVGLFVRLALHIGVSEIKENMTLLGWNFVPILFCYLLSTAIASYAWKLCFGKESEAVELGQLILLRLYTEAVSLINPTNIVGGDALKIYHLRKHSITTPRAINSVVLSRSILIVSQIILMLMAALYLVNRQQLLVVDSFGLVEFCIAIALLIGGYLILARYCFPFIAQLIFTRISSARKYTILRCLALLRMSKRQPIVLIQIYALSSMHWLIGGLELYLILHFLGVDFSLVSAMVADTGVSVLKVSGAFIPGQLGVEEFSLKYMLSILGIASGSLWVSVSIIRRMKQLFWIALGMILFSIYQFLFTYKLRKIGSIIRNA